MGGHKHTGGERCALLPFCLTCVAPACCYCSEETRRLCVVPVWWWRETAKNQSFGSFLLIFIHFFRVLSILINVLRTSAVYVQPVKKCSRGTVVYTLTLPVHSQATGTKSALNVGHILQSAFNISYDNPNCVYLGGWYSSTYVCYFVALMGLLEG